MKPLLTGLFLLAMSMSTVLTAQYHPTVTHTKEWLVKTCEQGGCLYDYYYFSADTVIGGLSYKVLNGFHYNKNFYLREDIQQRQVFLAINTGSPILNEFLLYDYGMKVGDSTYVQNPISPVAAIEGYYHLDSIVTKSFTGGARKVFYLHGRDTRGGYHLTKWIEGIGSTGLINTPGVMGDTTTMAELLCVTENATQVYERKPNDTCYSNPVFSLKERPGSPEWDWYFAQRRAELVFRQVPDGAELKLYSLGGKLLFERKISKGCEVSFRDLPSGLYVTLFESNGRTMVRKILKP